MKILMVAPEPIFEPRGTPFSVVGRLKALSDMGHQVDLITYPIGQDVALPNIRIIRTVRIPGIKKIKIGPSLKKIPLDFFLCIQTIIQLTCLRYDLIHTHEEAGFWGLILSRIFGIPHIYDMHSSLPQQLDNFQFTKSKILILLFESLERWILKYASVVITICPDLDNHVRSSFPEGVSILIENVVDYDTVFGEQDVSGKAANTLQLNGKCVALYTGTLEPYQGLDLLIQSAAVVVKEHPNIRFLVVGGHPDQIAFYQKQVKDTNLRPYFIFTGQVKPWEIKHFIQHADVLVSPRTSGTNTPLKIYSYLRSGVPIVATRLWTHTQVLDDSISVLKEPNPKDFALGIIEALTQRKLRRTITRNAQTLAEKKYSYHVYKTKLQKVMDLALQRGI